MTEDPQISVFRPDRPGIRKVLGDLEAEILELLWERPVGQGTAVREIFEVLYERRKTAYTTVMNTMTRMAKKRLLRVEKKEQAYIYYPVMARDAFISRFVERILEDLFVNFADATREGVDALADSEAAAHAHQLLSEIALRRQQEEEEEEG